MDSIAIARSTWLLVLDHLKEATTALKNGHGLTSGHRRRLDAVIAEADLVFTAPMPVPPPVERTWTLQLNEYQRNNLLLLLNACGYPSGNPHLVEGLPHFNTGDWLGEVALMLGGTLEPGATTNCTADDWRREVASAREGDARKRDAWAAVAFALAKRCERCFARVLSLLSLQPNELPSSGTKRWLCEACVELAKATPSSPGEEPR